MVVIAGKPVVVIAGAAVPVATEGQPSWFGPEAAVVPSGQHPYWVPEQPPMSNGVVVTAGAGVVVAAGAAVVVAATVVGVAHIEHCGSVPVLP